METDIVFGPDGTSSVEDSSRRDEESAHSPSALENHQQREGCQPQDGLRDNPQANGLLALLPAGARLWVCSKRSRTCPERRVLAPARLSALARAG